MLGNLFSTEAGRNFFNDVQPSSELLQFAEYSLTSKNPKTLFTTGVIIFNQALAFKGSLKEMNKHYLNYLQAVSEQLDHIANDAEALTAVLLSECRILYKNKELVDLISEDQKIKWTKAHSIAKIKTKDASSKEAVEDFLSLIGA
mmetsp:Transcript_31610/g.48342  ORF Transcript_31610/g.48342 Transcript_31610/m.48342 type:complete len:145 (-) Transcript_31610:32-466(-)